LIQITAYVNFIHAMVQHQVVLVNGININNRCSLSDEKGILSSEPVKVVSKNSPPCTRVVFLALHLDSIPISISKVSERRKRKKMSKKHYVVVQ
jgi:hypothetical protein